MNTANCKTIRREIDEANLETQLPGYSLEHLERCPQCRAYYHDQRTLRRLMSGFETVTAPADFDFKLRARLARERTNQIGVGFNRFSLGRIATATTLALALAVGAVLLRNWRSASTALPAAPAIADNHQVVAPAPDSSGPTQMLANQTASKSKETDESFAASGRKLRPLILKQAAERHSGTRLAVRDSALAPAAKVIANEPVSSDVVLVPMPGALRVTISNGKGNARTVSLPSVSFGSDRLTAHGSSFAPASSSRGSW